jgi:hypothetical protein
MRVMLVLLVLAVGGAFVAVVVGERDRGGDFYGFRPHAPDSSEEKAAAASAVAYALAIMKGDSTRACAYAAGKLSRRLRCARRPRRDQYLVADGRVEAEHVNLDGDRASVWLTGVSPGPGHAFELVRLGLTWRVISDTAFALA